MIFFCVLVTALLFAAFLLLAKVSPKEILLEIHELIASRQKHKTLKQVVEKSKGTEKQNFIAAMFTKAKNILIVTGRADKYGFFLRFSSVLACIGFIIGLCIQNIFLSAVLAVLGLLIPQFYIMLTFGTFKKNLGKELFTALSLINSSIRRTHNVVYAVRENMNDISPFLRPVFNNFLVQVSKIDANVGRAIMNLRGKIQNKIFQEWCDAVYACQDDHTKEGSLEPIVSELTDVIKEQDSLNVKLFTPIKTTIAMIALGIFILLMLALTGPREWITNILFTIQGKLSLAFMAGAITFALYRAVRITRPIELEKEDD